VRQGSKEKNLGTSSVNTAPNQSPVSAQPIKKIAIRKDSLQAFKQLVSDKKEQK
jgi:hypothetical protein